MVKLTFELIAQAGQYSNCVKDRELDLRGYKIPVIENLGATYDQFDTIDFSDNDIRKLDGFPLLKRVTCLLMNNNRIVRLGEGLENSLPFLERLILTNNSISELGDLDVLHTVTSLKHLSLLHNPVTNKPHYRLYVIYKVPQLKTLDFRKVKLKERQEAATLFKSKKGKEIQKDIKKTTSSASYLVKDGPKRMMTSVEDEMAIREAIGRATSLEEIERLNQILRAGKIPGKEFKAPGTEDDEDVDM